METVKYIHPRILDLMEMWEERYGEYKDPHELLLLDIDALYAYFAHKQGVRFTADLSKRPPNML